MSPRLRPVTNRSAGILACRIADFRVGNRWLGYALNLTRRVAGWKACGTAGRDACATTVWVAVAVSVLVVSNATGATPEIIPLPKEITQIEGVFQVKPGTRLMVDDQARPVGQYLGALLQGSSGNRFKLLESTKSRPAKGTILLTTKGARMDLGEEGYELNVNRDAVLIRAASAAGLFYGVQSLIQLLPPEASAVEPKARVEWAVPCVRIVDAPRFGWRGLLLDSARHFFTIQEVKQTLNTMALLKLNRFQWHLTDDQGWRIEIRKYPRLTEVGAWRKSIGFKLDPKASTAYDAAGRYGGYYSQAELRELVDYARARHINIVPEIEMPGHASAALAAFPQYSCSGGPYTTEAEGGVFAGVYCAGNEETYQFIQNVLAEVIEIFPSQYIHIGGDEVPKENWQKCPKCQARMHSEKLKTEHELQSYFVQRIEKYINSQGRTLIGWSEIREGGLAKNAVVMDWIGGAVEAASSGHDVVMTPTGFCYLDYYQSTNHANEPRAIGGYVPLSKIYAFEPIPADLPAEFQFHIQGGQGNLWTEYIANIKHVQYMIFPRLCALSEVLWSPRDTRNYEDFTRRLPGFNERLKQLGVNYRAGTANLPGE